MGRSASLTNPTYWWYRARERIFESFFGQVEQPVLDVGSADGPSAGWVGPRTTLDVDADALPDIVGSVLEIPLLSETYRTVGVFDVLEHVDDHQALREIRRVLKPGGTVLVAVPAYQWAWSEFDERSGHLRRYTKPRLAAALQNAGFEVVRVSYAFATTFPLFAADRITGRMGWRRTESPSSSQTPDWLGTVLLTMSLFDAWWLRRLGWLPFGSSIVAVGRLSAETELPGGQ